MKLYGLNKIGDKTGKSLSIMNSKEMAIESTKNRGDNWETVEITVTTEVANMDKQALLDLVKKYGDTIFDAGKRYETNWLFEERMKKKSDELFAEITKAIEAE